MRIFNARRITKIATVTAIYVVTTLLCSGIAYGQMQFRVSEMLMLLCFFNKDYIISMTLGCFIANLFSPLGLIDAVFGTVATLIAAILIYVFRKENNTGRLIVCSLFPVITNALIVSAELKVVFDLPYWANAVWVGAGEFVCVSILGTTVFRLLLMNKGFVKMVSAKSAVNKKK